MTTLLIALVMAQSAPERPKPYVPTDAYTTREIQGWSVRINKKLVDEHNALGDRAIELLDKKLSDIVSIVPAKALKRLRAIPIWLGVDDGHAPCAEYHPSRRWLADHGYNPDKARSVEIGSARRFVEWSKEQPSMVLHELAHAYHDQALTREESTSIERAYRRAVASGLYDRVKRNNGKEERHYALTNPQEFFAELTESYFGTNDFAPYDRKELELFDAETARLIGQLWKDSNEE